MADSPLWGESLTRKYHPLQWMPTPCFCHVQASGKKRRIDNAKRSGKNRLTQRSEKFCFNNALMPGVVVKAVLNEADKKGVLQEAIDAGFASGGEDMPDAFRSIPIKQEHLHHNIVGAKNPVTGKLEY